MTLFLRPIGNDVLIHPFEYPAKIGRIYVPDRSKKRVNQGIVIAKGPACQDDDVEVTDQVFFSGYTGDQISSEEFGKIFVVPETHIIAVVNPDNPIRLMDSETVKRIISERFGELRTKYEGEGAYIYHEDLDKVERNLLDRIDTLTIAEDWEF
ncbi:MAG: co-chaperone GroES [Nitrososphaerales archaeon]